MLDHVSIPAGEFERSARFYDAALAPLGLERIRTPELDGIRIADYGVGNVLAFSVGAPEDAPTEGWTVVPLVGMHIAFSARTRASVDAFYAAGGGMANENGFGGQAYVAGCRFVDNSAWLGGGMWNFRAGPTVVNALFAHNRATAEDGAAGGAVYSDFLSSPRLVN